MIDLRLGDCFELFKDIPAQSVDFICTDMPYGVTKAPWDCKVDLSALWTEIKRVLKPAGVCAMFGSGKFAYELAFSNFDWFRYRYCWFKGDCVTGFLNAKRRPLVASEDILIFSAKQGTYNQQRRLPKGGGGHGRMYTQRACLKTNGRFYGVAPRVGSKSLDGLRCPIDVLEFAPLPTARRINSTQKPQSVLEYLVKTYSNEGDLVLDPFMGSGSCGIACLNTCRNFIGFERDAAFYSAAKEWLAKELKQNAE